MREDGATYRRGKSVFDGGEQAEQEGLPEELFEEVDDAASPLPEAGPAPAAPPEKSTSRPDRAGPELIELSSVAPKAAPLSSRRLVQPAVSSQRPQVAAPAGRNRDVALSCLVAGVAAAAVPLSSPSTRAAVTADLASSAAALYGVVALLVAISGVILWSRTAKLSAPTLALAAFGALGQAVSLGLDAAQLASPQLNLGMGQGTLTLVGICGAAMVVAGISGHGLLVGVGELRSGQGRDLPYAAVVLGLSVVGLVIAFALVRQPLMDLLSPKRSGPATQVQSSQGERTRAKKQIWG